MTSEELEVLEDQELDEAIKELVKPENSLIIYNDDVNSFDHVILCLMRYCEHTIEQAEQCAMIAHTTGKCVVKTGKKEKLLAIFVALITNNITAEIQ